MWNPFRQNLIDVDELIDNVKSSIICNQVHLDLTHNNKIIIFVPIGDLPENRVQQHLHDISQIVKDAFPDLSKVVLLPLLGKNKNYSIQFVSTFK